MIPEIAEGGGCGIVGCRVQPGAEIAAVSSNSVGGGQPPRLLKFARNLCGGQFGIVSVDSVGNVVDSRFGVISIGCCVGSVVGQCFI